MTLTELIITNAVLAVGLVYALVQFLLHGIHGDRHLTATRAAEITRLPAHDRGSIAA